jgi:tetratricopeptide (TPR) repeat protein
VEFVRPRALARGLSLAAVLSGRAFGAPDAAQCELQGFRASPSWRELSAVEACAALPDLSPAKRADAFIESAEIRAQVGDHAGALGALDSALKLSPGHPEASFLWAQLGRDRPEQALRHAEQAARSAASPRRRAAAHRLAGEIRLDLDDESGARSSLERALELAGDEPDALRLMVLLKRAQPAQAASYARRACAAAAALPAWQRGAGHRLCAQILAEIEDFGGAETSLKRALDLDPDDLKALQALIHIKRRRPREAAASAPALPAPSPAGEAVLAPTKEDQARALAQDPYDLEALRAFFELKRAENRPAEAVYYAERFTTAIRRAPAWLQSDAYSASTRMWLELRDLEKARHTATRAQELNYQFPASFPHVPNPADPGAAEESLAAYHAVVGARMELEDHAGAQAALERALGRFPGDPHLLESMVDLMLSRSRLGEARAYAERLVEAAAKASPSADSKEPGVGYAESSKQALEHARLGASRKMIQVQLALGRPQAALAWADRLVKASETASPSRRADAYEQRARARRALKDEAGARRSLERALELAPDHVPALRALIELELAQGRPAEALARLELLAKILESASPVERAGVYARRARIQRELKDEAGAQQSLKRALELAPDHAPALQDMISLKLADEAAVQKSLERVLEPGPEHVPALQELVRLKLARRRHEEAAAWIERLAHALRNAPPAERAAVHVQLADVLRELKDQAGVQKSLERALELAPAHAPALEALVRLTLEQGRPKEALARERRELKDEAGVQKSLERALELAPAHVPALHEMVQLKLEQRRHEEALVWLERLEKASERASPSERARRELKDEAGVQKSLERALELSPEHAPALHELAQLKLAQKKPGEVLALLDGPPASGKPQAVRLVLRGLARAALEDDSAAREDFRAAVGLDPAAACFDELLSRNRNQFAPSYFDFCLEGLPDNPALHLDRGVSRYLSGRKDEAETDFRKAVELKPDYPEAYLSLASALIAQGRSDEALAAADKAFELARPRRGPLYEQIVGLRGSLRQAGRAVKR